MMKLKNFLIIVLGLLSFIPTTIFAYTGQYPWDPVYIAPTQETQNRDTVQRLKSQYGISAYYDCYPCIDKDTSNPYTQTSCLLQAEYCLERQAMQKETTCSSGYVYVNGRCITKDQKCIYDLGPNQKWSSGTICVCEDGYEVNGNGQCVTPDQVCSGTYGINSIWSGTKNANGSLTCACKTGYVWNSQRTGCIIAPVVPVKTNDQICQDNYGLNSNWDGTKNANGGLICDCKTGYKWNSNQTACVKNEIIISPEIKGVSDNNLIPEGAIIRVENGIDIYIIKYVGAKKFKRLILSPSVFNNYGHLKWENVMNVSQAVLDSYTTSNLVRAVGDDKIYWLYAQGDTGQKRLVKNSVVLTKFGLDPDSIYEINNFDRESYVDGLDLE